VPAGSVENPQTCYASRRQGEGSRRDLEAVQTAALGRCCRGRNIQVVRACIRARVRNHSPRTHAHTHVHTHAHTHTHTGSVQSCGGVQRRLFLFCDVAPLFCFGLWLHCCRYPSDTWCATLHSEELCQELCQELWHSSIAPGSYGKRRVSEASALLPGAMRPGAIAPWSHGSLETWHSCSAGHTWACRGTPPAPWTSDPKSVFVASRSELRRENTSM
jgi:hypothetical protein